MILIYNRDYNIKPLAEEFFEKLPYSAKLALIDHLLIKLAKISEVSDLLLLGTDVVANEYYLMYPNIL